LSIVPSPSIIIDSREASQAEYIVQQLKKKIPVLIKKLDAADYLFNNNVAVERKSGLNLYQDIISRRLFEQLENMCELYHKPILLIENLNLSQQFYRNIAAVCRGALVTILLNWRTIRILFTSDEKDTVNFLIRLALRLGVRGSKPIPRCIKKGIAVNEIRSYMLQCIRGIGPKKAEQILKRFNTFDDLSRASLSDFEEILTKKISRVLYNIFHEVRK